MRRSLAVMVLCSLLLSRCGGASRSPPEQPIAASSAIAGLRSTMTLAAQFIVPRPARPTAMLGLFTSMFLAHGSYTHATSSAAGVQATALIMQGQSQPTTDETFRLLQEFGALLQIDIPDLLNRSPDRATSLDLYIRSLRDVGSLAHRKTQELSTQLDALEEERQEKRAAVRDMERAISTALKEEDYGTAASKQQQLTDAQGALAQVETRESLTSDIVDRYEEMIEIGTRRLTVLEKNREALIAGISIVDVPGIEDFGLIMEMQRSRSSRGANPFEGQ